MQLLVCKGMLEAAEIQSKRKTESSIIFGLPETDAQLWIDEAKF